MRIIMFIDTRPGQERYLVSPPRDAGMRIAETMLETVVFLGRILDKGGLDEHRPTGTGVIISMPLLDGGIDSAYYLVTNKHVADRLVSGGKWFIRFNGAEGVKEIIGTADDRTVWFNHPDPAQTASVDVAVMPLVLPSGVVANKAIFTRDFVTEEVIATNGIGPGSEVFVIGLFTKMTGKSKNIPLVRIANIAMMPKEKVPNIKIGDYVGESELILLEVKSLGGLSGSPAWALETRQLTNLKSGQEFFGNGSMFFLGIMCGHWMIREEEANNVEIQTVRDSEGSIATGLSLLVPAKKILEVLNHPTLQLARSEMAKQLKQASGTNVNT